MPITIPFTFVPDTTASADEVNACFQAIKVRFDAGIRNEDISSSAGIDGNKLSQVAGSQIPTAALGDNQVTFAKLSSSAGTDSSRAVGTDHIRDLAVTAAKIANTTITKGKVAASQFTVAQLNVLVVTAAFSVTNISPTQTISVWTGGTPAIGTHLPISWYISTSVSGSGQFSGTFRDTNLNLTWITGGLNTQSGTITASFLVRS